MAGFTPILPMGGYTGLKFLDRTAEKQRIAFEKSPMMTREVQHFLENIASADTPEKLLSDPLLAKVALGAFGLEGERGKKAFLQRILEQGTDNREAFANRIADGRFRKLAKAFGYGNAGGAPVTDPTFAAEIAARYQEMQFEVAIGEQDNAMRLALNFRREVPEIVAALTEDSNGWLQILGQQPLRRVVEAAFGLPAAFAQIDIDRQVEILQDKATQLFGESSARAFGGEDAEANIETVLRRFLAREAASGPAGLSTPAARALSLLGGGGGGGASAASLLLARA